VGPYGVAVTDPSLGPSEQLPLFPLGTVLVPGMRLSLHVFEPRYRQLVADLLNAEDPGAPEFGVVALKQGWEVGELKDVYDVGTTARVTDVLPHPDGRCDLAAVGERRFVIESLDTTSQPYLMATVYPLGEPAGEQRPGPIAAVHRALEAHLNTLTDLDADLGDLDELADLVADDELGKDPQALSYAVAKLMSLPLSDRQALLAVVDTAGRLRAARSVLRRETELLRQLRAVPASAATFRSGSASS
jgi:Lon protease-like protein